MKKIVLAFISVLIISLGIHFNQTNAFASSTVYINNEGGDPALPEPKSKI